MFGILIIILTFIANPWIGAIITTIILYDYCKKKKLEIKAVKNTELWPKICPPPGRTADELIMYKKCTVEIYRNPFNVARVIKPDGKDLGVSFKSVANAIMSIDSHVD